MIFQSTIPCTKKWSAYYTCKECEDEVNRKGHLTKLQEAVHVDNVKYIIIKSEFNAKLLCTHPQKLNKHHVYT